MGESHYRIKIIKTKISHFTSFRSKCLLRKKSRYIPPPFAKKFFFCILTFGLTFTALKLFKRASNHAKHDFFGFRILPIFSKRITNPLDRLERSHFLAQVQDGQGKRTKTIHYIFGSILKILSLPTSIIRLFDPLRIM